ncbi:hypothetical protein ACFPOE_22250 [Caenimonas terrae]|uniref:SH3 domain-containing protein n=1 Tax=Caenimonas terrae TaxID=696074 RepID=A0ABW0NI55_9BURK
MAATTLAAVAVAATMQTAIVTSDQAALRAAPRDSAQQQAQLWQGEVLEVRGERLDYLQVYDHRRERAGFVRASQVRRSALAPADAPELLAVLRFVQERPGSEALGIGIAAAWLQAAPAEALNGSDGIAALDALGTMADRLARRASSGAALTKPQEAALSAHLDVARHYGVNFASYERDGRMTICYDGEAFRRVLAMKSVPEQRARAALALTRTECVDPNLQPLQRAQVDQWRADVLERVDAARLPGWLRNRVLMRRASVAATVAYQRTRQGLPAADVAQKALAELASVSKSELTDVDQPAYNDAAMRVNASRWAALPAVAVAAAEAGSRNPFIVTVPGQPGETCVLLVDAKHDEKSPLARRCTYAIVWAGSASLNREGNALALAVQPLEAWRELWLFRKDARGAWDISVLPPATTNPDLGYAEFAGWVPGGKQVLVAREARGEGKYKRSFEVLKLASLTAERQAAEPAMLGAFNRWQDAGWKGGSVSLR